VLGSTISNGSDQEEDPFGGNNLAVSFDKNEGHFLMNDLKTGPGTYVRLDNYMEIKSGYTVVFGTSAIVF